MKLTNNEMKCPYCGSEELEYYNHEEDNGYQVEYCTCVNCGKKVQHIYELVYVETVAYDD